MPVSVLEIDVDDAKFKKFQEAYEKYSSSLKGMPGLWSKTGEAIDGSFETFGKISALLLAQNELIHKQTDAHDAANRSAEKGERTFSSIRSHTQGILHDVRSVAETLVKWVTLGGLVSGLVGGGTLWGFDRLAGSAAGIRRSSAGLGINAGEQSAFSINYGRFVEPNSFLQNVANTRSDWSKRAAFLQMGIDPDKGDTADLGVKLVRRAKELFDSSDMSQQTAQARGLTQFFSMDELRRLHNMTTRQVTAAEKDYGTDRRALNVGNGTLDQYQDFLNVIRRAGQLIENSFIKALVKLTPGLEKLSGDVARFIDVLVNSGVAQKAIDAVGHGLAWLGDYLSSDQIKTDFQGFVDAITRISSALEAVAKWAFGWLGSNSSPAPGVSLPSDLWGHGRGGVNLDFAGSGVARVLGGTDFPPIDVTAGTAPPTADDSARLAGAWIRRRMASWGFKQSGINPNTGLPLPWADVEAQNDLPRGTLDSIWANESGRGVNPGPSAKGALGDFQFMPGTGKEYGLDAPADFMDRDKEAKAAGRYLRHLIDEFNGNLAAGIAAYNAGPGKVQDAMMEGQAYHRNWMEFLPKETINYLKNLNPSLGVRVQIDNNTGANPNVTATQLRHQ